jgi:hypothetical protein
MNYLLPCPACGTKSTVSSALAGQSIQCSCGRTIEVPTLRDLRQLESEGEPERPQTTWSRRKGLVFLGCVMMAVSAGFAGWFASKLPRGLDPAAVRAEVDALDPAASFILYEGQRPPMPVEQGPGKLIRDPVVHLLKGTFENPHPRFRLLAFNEAIRADADAAKRKTVVFWFPMLGGVGLIGMLVALSALLVRDDSARPLQKGRIREPSRP